MNLAAPITELVQLTEPVTSSPVGCLRLLWHPVNMKLEAVLGGFRGQPSGRVHYLMLHMPRQAGSELLSLHHWGAVVLWLTQGTQRNVQSKLGLVLWDHVIQIFVFFLSALNSSHFRTGTEPSWLRATHSHLSSPPSQTGFCLVWRKTMLLYQFTCFCEHVTI